LHGRMTARHLHTRRAAEGDDVADTDASHHDGSKFRNPWVDPAEFSDKKLLDVAKFMWASATQQVCVCVCVCVW
jgi:hypothetical protein